jgi:hypothetical protein
MSSGQRFNNFLTGAVAGALLPFLAFLVFFLITRHGLSAAGYLQRVKDVGNVAEIISVSVFANIIIFLTFNRLDMLRASRGVLGITIIWAFIVFGIKLF